MPEPLTLKVDHSPSIFNKTMLMGALIGSLVPGGALATGLMGCCGALVGGFMGKNRLEKESQEGKEVKEPSFWNRDTALGGLIGHHAGAILAGVVAMAILTAGAASAGVDLSSITQNIGSDSAKAAINMLMEKASGHVIGAVVAAFCCWVGGTALGGYIGGKNGHERLQKEYEQALQQNQELIRSVGKGISPEVGEAVDMALGGKTDWGEAMLKRGLEKAALGAGR